MLKRDPLSLHAPAVTLYALYARYALNVHCISLLSVMPQAFLSHFGPHAQSKWESVLSVIGGVPYMRCSAYDVCLPC